MAFSTWFICWILIVCKSAESAPCIEAYLNCSFDFLVMCQENGDFETVLISDACSLSHPNRTITLNVAPKLLTLKLNNATSGNYFYKLLETDHDEKDLFNLPFLTSLVIIIIVHLITCRGCNSMGFCGCRKVNSQTKLLIHVNGKQHTFFFFPVHLSKQNMKRKVVHEIVPEKKKPRINFYGSLFLKICKERRRLSEEKIIDKIAIKHNFDPNYEASRVMECDIRYHNIITLCCAYLKSKILQYLVGRFGFAVLCISSSRITVAEALMRDGMRYAKLAYKSQEWKPTFDLIMHHDPRIFYKLDKDNDDGRRWKSPLHGLTSEFRFEDGSFSCFCDMVKQIAREWIDKGALLYPYPFSGTSDLALEYEAYLSCESLLLPFLPFQLVQLSKGYLETTPLFGILLRRDCMTTVDYVCLWQQPYLDDSEHRKLLEWILNESSEKFYCDSFS